ncbi:hypothetical protein B0J12DRAFT_691146 [Macrophomina phaseolina]|uniref:Secreted protein n=1 Tax=Macrophomina phaseolina TaxID=35725 RepID=A0ABQ8FQ75_9PEZI|nr:hypothetical protein B0J12DRAFT_691146 [Macrophomina phaseolina]
MHISTVLLLGLVPTAVLGHGCQHAKITYLSNPIPQGKELNSAHTDAVKNQWKDWVAANSQSCGGTCGPVDIASTQPDGSRVYSMSCYAARLKKGPWPALAGPGDWGAIGKFEHACDVHCKTRGNAGGWREPYTCTFQYGKC